MIAGGNSVYGYFFRSIMWPKFKLLKFYFDLHTGNFLNKKSGLSLPNLQ